MDDKHFGNGQVFGITFFACTNYVAMLHYVQIRCCLVYKL